jgi:hypothetical protein
MALKTYKASCHCGAVRLEADIDLSAGTTRCNCSLCTKARAWFVFVRPDSFRLMAGTEALTEYQWTPTGRPHPALHYHFCNACGIRTFAWGESESMGGRFYALAVTAIDDADADDLAAAPLRFVDGRQDRFDQPPAEHSASMRLCGGSAPLRAHRRSSRRVCRRFALANPRLSLVVLRPGGFQLELAMNRDRP